MIYNNVILNVTDPDNISLVASLLTEQAELSRAEPGCARFEVYQSQTEPATFMLVEQWQSEAHLQAHREAPAFLTLYTPKVLPLVSRTAHNCQLLSS